MLKATVGVILRYVWFGLSAYRQNKFSLRSTCIEQHVLIVQYDIRPK